ncbi:MAG: lantibiotic dehydratase, partial [Myxococcota bacterium]
DRYRALRAGVAAIAPDAPLPAGAAPFRVDLLRPLAAAELGPLVVAEVARGIAALHAMYVPGEDPLWSDFRARFVARYGQRTVPLPEVMDEIGFRRVPGQAVATPSLSGLAVHRPAPRTQTLQWTPAMSLILGKMERAWQHGHDEIELTPDELAGCRSGALRPLPDALSAMITVLAPTPAAIDAGDFRVVLTIAAGPSGIRQLARYGGGDEPLTDWLQSHVQAEEALRPDAVFAEIVHAPAGAERSADICVRPLLRPYEIPYLGRSGAPPERQLAVADLLVEVRDGRVRLRSRRLGREVIPRLSAPDNFKRETDDTYAFLCELQAEGRIHWLFPRIDMLSHA